MNEEIKKQGQYYSMPFEDVRVGYVYEVEDSPYEPCWSKEKIEDLYDLESFCSYTKKDPDCLYRVKYLTKEQIEAEGWELDSTKKTFMDFVYKDRESFLRYYPKDNYIEIERDNEYKSTKWHTSFRGYCKSINEFRTIIKLLGI